MSNYLDVITWWQNQSFKSISDYSTVLENFEVVFATNSENIEGSELNYHTTRAVFEDKNLSSYTGPLNSLFAVRNQKFAFDVMLRGLLAGLDINLEFIKRLHKVLLSGCYDQERWDKGERPGKFKVGDYCVGTDSVGSFPEEVEDDLQDLLDELYDCQSDDILTKAAYFHACFETIHPFADGNGRVGRMLLNYYLMRNNYPPIIIYDEDKETYYMALEVYNKTEELSGMILFFQEQMVKTWSRYLGGVTPDKVTWCVDNAPEALRDLPKDEIVSLMESAYERMLFELNKRKL